MRLISVGRLVEQKNYGLLLEALARVGDTGVTLTVIGEGPDRTRLEVKARQLGLADRVKFPGFMHDIAPVLAVADAFVLSSKWEGFGHVMVEAMAAGLPVISTDCPHGPRDILTGDLGSLLVPNENPAALAVAIDLIGARPDLAAELAELGRRRAEDFDADAIARDYASIIARIGTRRRPLEPDPAI